VFLRWYTTGEVLTRMVESMPALRWMHIPRAGVDSSLVPAVLERDFLITNSAGVHAIPIAEFVMLYMLCYVKRVPELLQAQADHCGNEERIQLVELAGKTLLLIGMGQIGRAIAARAAAFGMRVLGSSRSGAAVPGVELMVAAGHWRELLGEADYIVIA